MRRIRWLIAVLLPCGCSATTANVDAEKTDSPEVARAAPQREAVASSARLTTSATKINTAMGPLAIAQAWENSSCGERRYRRQIDFKKDGTFVAVDEVAPCPRDVQCVWSGIINWHGNWKRNGPTIALTSVLPRAGKMPDSVPEQFVILSENPISIGEKQGTIVCPYQRSR